MHPEVRPSILWSRSTIIIYQYTERESEAVSTYFAARRDNWASRGGAAGDGLFLSKCGVIRHFITTKDTRVPVEKVDRVFLLTCECLVSCKSMKERKKKS